MDLEDEESYVVIELSSFMLETLRKKNLVSLLGSIFPVHLDWHGNMENYVKAKANILQGSETNIMFSATKSQYFSSLPVEHLVLSGKDTPYTWDGQFFYAHGRQLFALSEVKILGEHNLRNISAVVALADVLQISDAVLVDTIANFAPVRHRLELV